MGKDHPKQRAIGQAMIGAGAGMILLCVALGLGSLFIARAGGRSLMESIIPVALVTSAACLGPAGLLGLLTVLAGAALWVWSE